jgi:hypothetical protein
LGTNEEDKIYREPDHRHFKGAGSRQKGGRDLPGAWHQSADLLRVESKYSGLEVNQVKRMKELEAELSQYKKIVAEQTLHITVLKDVIEKKL